MAGQNTLLAGRSAIKKVLSNLASIQFVQYSSASMMVSTRSVTAGSAGSGEW